jgi:hypothetical protein
MGDPLAPRYLAQPTLYEPATKNRTKASDLPNSSVPDYTSLFFFALNNLLTTMSFSVSLGFSLISVVLKRFQQHLQGALDSMGWEGNSRRCTLLRFNIRLLSIAFIANSLPVSRSSTKCTL